MQMPNLNTYTLNNGVNIPVLGLGVYRMPDNEATVKSIQFAFSNGYRHIDTAMIYNNERAVGRAINSGTVARNEIFITTKVWNSDQGYDQTIRAFNASLSRLDTDYIDLYLIHWPVQNKRKDTWKALETLYNDKKCKAIGVSNYLKQHLDELLGFCNVIPAVNQLELHPFIYGSRLETLAICSENKILPVAYSPLTKGEKLRNTVLKEIATHYKKTTAQVLIRWAIQHGFGVIPKSSVSSRISENSDVFDFGITDDDMEILDGLNENLATGWDPSDAL